MSLVYTVVMIAVHKACFLCIVEQLCEALGQVALIVPVYGVLQRSAADNPTERDGDPFAAAMTGANSHLTMLLSESQSPWQWNVRNRQWRTHSTCVRTKRMTV